MFASQVKRGLVVKDDVCTITLHNFTLKFSAPSNKGVRNGHVQPRWSLFTKCWKAFLHTSVSVLSKTDV